MTASLECIRALLVCGLISCALLGAGALKFLNPPPIILHGVLGLDMDINCSTDDPNATVSLLYAKNYITWTERTVEPNKLILHGHVFTLLKLAIGDGGKYNCKATAGSQSIRWPQIIGYMVLESGQLPYYFALVPNFALILLRGGDGQILCETEGTTVSKLQWKKITAFGEENVPDSKVTNVVDNAKNLVKATLKITNAQPQDAGEYKCLLTAYSKTDRKLTSIRVVGPDPANITASSNHSILVDSDRDLELVCQTIGFPPPVVTWRKDNQSIPECHEDEPCAATERYLVTQKGLKIVKPRYPDDDAEFSCKAKNDFGEVQKSFIVVVPSAPVLDISYAKTYYWTRPLTKPKYIPCVLAEGSPAPSLWWSYKVCWSLNACMPSWVPVAQLKPNIFQVKDGKRKRTLVVTSQYLPQYLYFKCTAKNMKGKDEIIAGLFERSNGRRY